MKRFETRFDLVFLVYIVHWAKSLYFCATHISHQKYKQGKWALLFHTSTTRFVRCPLLTPKSCRVVIESPEIADVLGFSPQTHIIVVVEIILKESPRVEALKMRRPLLAQCNLN